MVAVREQILVALKTVLATIPGVAVTRSLDRPVVTFPSINLVDGSHDTSVAGDGDDAPFGVRQYKMDITTELYVTGMTSEAANTALHALYASVVKKIMGDETLGGIALRIDEQGMDQPEIGSNEGQGPTQAAALDFLITFWTLINDPETVAP